MPPRKRTAPGAETPEGNTASSSRTERRVRVRFRKAVAASSRSFRAGEVVEVDRATLAAFVAAGWAEAE